MSSAAVVLMARAPGGGQQPLQSFFPAAVQPAKDAEHDRADTGAVSVQDPIPVPAQVAVSDTPLDQPALPTDNSLALDAGRGTMDQFGQPQTTFFQQARPSEAPFEMSPYGMFPGVPPGTTAFLPAPIDAAQLMPVPTNEYPLPSGEASVLSSRDGVPEVSTMPVMPDVPAAPVMPRSVLSAPVVPNAFDRLWAKRKPDDKIPETPADSSPQLPAPKKRGRPPKKRKSDTRPEMNADTTAPEAGAPASALDDSKSSNALAMADTGLGHTTVLALPVPSTVSSATERPVRLMQFNRKTGTFGSGPFTSGNGMSPTASVPRPLVVPYGQQDPTVRQRLSAIIGAVLSGEHRVFPSPSPSRMRTSKKAAAMAAAPKQPLSSAPGPTSTPDMYGLIAPRLASPASSASQPPTDAATKTTPIATHPFFTTNRARSLPKSQASGASSASKASASGLSAEYSSASYSKARASPAGLVFRASPFGAKSGILRVPGACLPAWPWKGAVHVHPEDDDCVMAAVVAGRDALPSVNLHTGRRKGNAVELRADELILEHMMQSLHLESVIQAIHAINADDFAPPLPELRVPQKHIETGVDLASQIAPQLRSENAGVQPLLASLPTALSAFDKHQCETMSWTQKYAPSCAVEVLQSGDEPRMLRDWLAALQVVSVDTGTGESGDAKSGVKGGGGKAKLGRKRKKNKLDGFIVSSDDEGDDMDGGDVSDNEVDWSASGRYGLLKKTVVRSGGIPDKAKARRGGVKLANAVVISGPHGCGKSAAVYAVARELGFEVFEINASSRRSGRDVIDRIGDMTKNHLVQHKAKKRAGQQPLKASTDTGVVVGAGDEDASDLEDGEYEPDPDYPLPIEAPAAKQPTMNAFFMPATASAAAVAERGAKVMPASQDNRDGGDGGDSSARPGQKQSLILIEEADILYEEDKQFWTTVTSLMAQSKRPFVMTCNDETLLPLHNLRLHAMFRFTAPPSDAAVDRLLLVAANEGHALQRRAVQSLLAVRDHDMRAALTDLQFWCQIGVGDQKGGFGWFLQRWPEGIDLDADGRPRRVISEGTYQEGMGWLGNDAAESHEGRAVEMDLVEQTWTNWQLDMGQWQDALDLGTWAARLEPVVSAGATATATDQDRHAQWQQLAAYSQFSDSMSDADLLSSMVFATGNAVPLDATQPELPPKARDDFILGQQLLGRTTAVHENDFLRLPLATAMRCTAKQLLRGAVRMPDICDADGPDGPDRTLDYIKMPRALSGILAHHTRPCGLVPDGAPVIGRIDFSLAFDPIAEAGSPSTASGYFEPSVFDRNLTPIVTDVAPFVRGIVAYEGRRGAQRRQLGTFLTGASAAPSLAATAALEGDDEVMDDGSDPSAASAARPAPPKRMRMTRTALSALQGSSRSATRRDKWFEDADVNPVLVMRTAGDGWNHVAEQTLAQLNVDAARVEAQVQPMVAVTAADASAAVASVPADAIAASMAVAAGTSQANMTKHGVDVAVSPPPMQGHNEA